MKVSSIRANASAIPRIGQNANAFAPTCTPGSHASTLAGETAATGSCLNNRPVAALLSFGRAGRAGPTAAWPGARSNPRLRVAPSRDAGKFMDDAA